MPTSIYWNQNSSFFYSTPIYYNYNFRNPYLKLFHDSNGYYHLIYMIINKINNKIYIGKHSTKNPYDDYMSSSKILHKSIKKYSLESFEKIIIDCLPSSDAAYKKEAEIVTPEFANRKETYNIKSGGKGSGSGISNHNYGKPKTQEIKNKISESLKGHIPWNKGLQGIYHISEDTKNKLSVMNKGKNNHFFGKTHSKEFISKISGSNSPFAKAIQKLDLDGNIIAEYGCMKECYEHENMSKSTLQKYIKLETQYKGFYYRYKE